MLNFNEIETHPLEPFLPSAAKLLMLGSFPPPVNRWSMDFYYPNFQNDMWRIMGLIFFSDKEYFIRDKKFHQPSVEAFCREKGIAISDSARQVIRTRGNASDQHLQIITPLNLSHVLLQIPSCRSICVTGGKAAETIAGIFPILKPALKNKETHSHILIEGQTYQFYRMPSSSRAYPKLIEFKAEAYRQMFTDLGLL